MSFKSQVDPSPVVLGSTPCASQTNRGSPSLLLEPVPPACPAHHVDFVSWLCRGRIGAGILVTYNLAPFEGQGHIGKGSNDRKMHENYPHCACTIFCSETFAVVRRSSEFVEVRFASSNQVFTQ